MTDSLTTRSVAALADSAAIALRRVSDSLHIAILERSADAAALSASWTGVVVGVLGVLFAVLAIVTAFTLYRQTKEFHARAEAMVAGYREIVERVAEEARAMAATTIEGIQSEAAEVSKKLSALGSEQESERTTLEKHRERLEVRLKQLEDREQAFTVAAKSHLQWGASPAWSASSARQIAEHQRAQDALTRSLDQTFPPRRSCPKCGWRQTHRDAGLILRGGLLQCPQCSEILP